MGNAFDKYGTVIRYVISWVTGYLAGKYGWNAAQTGQFGDAIYGAIAALAALGTLGYALFKQPSGIAMKVAHEADKILAGQKPAATVVTPPGQPNIVVQPAKGGQG